jgi:hypothetical protein
MLHCRGKKQEDEEELDEEAPTGNTRKTVAASKCQPQKGLLDAEELDRRLRDIADSKTEKILALQGELERVRSDYEEQGRRLEEQAKDNEWLTKFCLSFVSMAGQVSSLQGYSIVQPCASLRRNTKIAWKFFKGFVKSVI